MHAIEIAERKPHVCRYFRQQLLQFDSPRHLLSFASRRLNVYLLPIYGQTLLEANLKRRRAVVRQGRDVASHVLRRVLIAVVADTEADGRQTLTLVAIKAVQLEAPSGFSDSQCPGTAANRSQRQSAQDRAAAIAARISSDARVT